MTERTRVLDQPPHCARLTCQSQSLTDWESTTGWWWDCGRINHFPPPFHQYYYPLNNTLNAPHFIIITINIIDSICAGGTWHEQRGDIKPHFLWTRINVPTLRRRRWTWFPLLPQFTRGHTKGQPVDIDSSLRRSGLLVLKSIRHTGLNCWSIQVKWGKWVWWSKSVSPNYYEFGFQ